MILKNATDLINWRKDKGFNQTEAAAFVGVSFSAYRSWETGFRPVPHWVGRWVGVDVPVLADVCYLVVKLECGRHWNAYQVCACDGKPEDFVEDLSARMTNQIVPLRYVLLGVYGTRKEAEAELAKITREVPYP
jgi:hypothetical protein